MKCPHCTIDFHDNWNSLDIGIDEAGAYQVHRTVCSACQRLVAKLLIFHVGPSHPSGLRSTGIVKQTRLIQPKVASRSTLSSHVPEQFSEVYYTAALILEDSPEASAALSRRCLQELLREQAGVKPSSLANEIQEVLDTRKLPSYLAEQIDGIRNHGNFAAHPNKSINTGEILPVEAGEAEWCLDTLEGLFDFYFVLPQVVKERREALNGKLKQAGKPPMK